MTDESIAPNTGKLLQRYEPLSAAQLERALTSAEAAFRTWEHTYVESSPFDVIFCVEPWRLPLPPAGQGRSAFAGSARFPGATKAAPPVSNRAEAPGCTPWY